MKRYFPSHWFLFIALAAWISTGCNKVFPCNDEDFTLHPGENANGKLRIDGYYYWITDTTRPADEQENYIITLYSNGVIRESGHTSGATRDDYYRGQPARDTLQQPEDWDLYRVDGDVFTTEDKHADLCIYYRSRVAVSKAVGRILSDSSFQITGTTGTGAKATGFAHRFFFRQFSPKLDSANAFF